MTFSPLYKSCPRLHVYTLTSVFHKLGVHPCLENKKKKKNEVDLCFDCVRFYKEYQTKAADRDIYLEKEFWRRRWTQM